MGFNEQKSQRYMHLDDEYNVKFYYLIDSFIASFE